MHILAAGPGRGGKFGRGQADVRVALCQRIGCRVEPAQAPSCGSQRCRGQVLDWAAKFAQQTYFLWGMA